LGVTGVKTPQANDTIAKWHPTTPTRGDKIQNVSSRAAGRSLDSKSAYRELSKSGLASTFGQQKFDFTSNSNGKPIWGPNPQGKSDFIRELGVPGANTRFCGALARFHTNPYLGPNLKWAALRPRSGSRFPPQVRICVEWDRTPQKRVLAPRTTNTRIKSDVIR
jgi:hypothetical protein